MTACGENTESGPWNPGLTSEIPQRLMPLVTLYRPENSDISYREARELSDLTGLALEDLTSLKAERLIVHELMVRVTADLSVPDGPNYEELGINLRGMVDTIFQNHARPELPAFRALLDKIRTDAQAAIEAELAARMFAGREDEAEPEKSWLSRLFGVAGKAETGKKIRKSPEEAALEALDGWKRRRDRSGDPWEKAWLDALHKVAGVIVRHRGRLINDPALIARLAAIQVANGYGSARIGEALVPAIGRAVKAEGYRFLPAQEKPLIMNVKGASASGKSTIRAQQRRLAERIGVSWEDFALISPDYWRKYLIDYDALGGDYKYAAMLTGRELEIIDRKLDLYMAGKAANKRISHLLIDRFRFDSFASQQMAEADSRLLTRFGDTVYLFFMITPPEETVERAWARGLTTGRYKAVDDLLYHNIEAYTGMPQLFFSWALSANKRVHFEFLDNSVEKGERPRTAAFGWNGDMTILDLGIMKKIETFKHIDIEARTRDEVYRAQPKTGNETTFLMQCARTIPVITLASYETGVPYARLENGECVWIREGEDARAVLDAFGLDAVRPKEIVLVTSLEMIKERQHTVGTWASAASGISAEASG